jgi:acetyl esterase/lipase
LIVFAVAPMLFYLEGLKEAHETGDNRNELQGPERIPYSVTAQSVTFLIDVDEMKLVHHSAEVDYLDPKRPLILLFPAEPLKHGTHYAVAVVRAKDENGRNLPRTRGMDSMLKGTNSESRTRVVQKVIPALERAAPWYSFAKEPESLQLLFDFMTVSEESQLGPIRAARDIALETVQAWDWKEHVEVVAVINHECDASGDDSLVARTVHLNLDVPWFLRQQSRYAFLDDKKVQRTHPVTIGKAKAMVQIPCSVMNAAVGKAGKKLRAVMEYGHGLFYHRGEMTDRFLQKMANDNGYVLMAMDWRGMSAFDLPVVIKTLVGSPQMFQAVRDNLIQGFANKMCMQHFSQNGMLELDAFRFGSRSLPTLNHSPPTSIYYGISQGGILGAGYLSVIGRTKLVERGILGVPGTPFALVLSRSLDFAGYDRLLLLNFYNNRHVRIMLTLVQMAWDSTEASGQLARPVSEILPRILLQAGLGDPVVPTIAAETLARAMRASTLPNNPRDIYGVPVADAASNEAYLGPDITLVELLYEKEYNSLPLDDTFAKKNAVHYCVRMDKLAIRQIEEFVNTGRVIDICAEDQCRRASAVC